MGLYVRVILRKKKNDKFRKFPGKVILLFLLLSLPQLGLQAGKYQPIVQSAQSLLHPDQATDVHPSLWLRDILLHGSTLPDSLQQILISQGYKIYGTTRLRTDRPESQNLELSLDAGIFRFHYTLTGINATDPVDISGNGIPDYVDSVITIFEEVYQTEILALEYDLPPNDGSYSAGMDNGGSASYDVYIRNLSSGYYGYVQGEIEVGDNPNSPQVTETNAWTSYMAIRNNYDGFPNSEMNNIRVTVAHEFFHAIQYGYDAWEKNWLLEATSVWMEETVYDDINDCYQYLPDWFSRPHLSLNPENDSRWYGSYIFFEYITAHLGGQAVIRRMFDESRIHDSYGIDNSTLIIDNALAPEASGFVDAFTKMAIANRILSSSSTAGIYSYDEAEAYPVYPDGPHVLDIIRFTPGTSDTVFSSNLEQYGTNYIFLSADQPMKYSLFPEIGNSTDYHISAILKTADNQYYIKTGNEVNIDPVSNGFTWMYIVVSAIEEESDYQYQLVVTDGQQEEEQARPFLVSGPQPNPFFQQGVVFRISSLRNQYASVKIYNQNGALIRTVFTGDWLENETYSYRWNGKNRALKMVSSGVYFIVITASDDTAVWLPVTFIH